MSEEHWCQKCWMTKRTELHHELGSQWLCEECFDHIVTEALKELGIKGLIEK